MPQGRLEVAGAIDLGQFWQTGESDADTVKVTLPSPNAAFRFRPHPGAAFHVTHAFRNARVRGQGSPKPVVDTHDRITVRLQGVDAPELHYQPQPAVRLSTVSAAKRTAFLQWNHDYRQRWAETATVKLAARLRQAGQDPLRCTVVTQVDEPNEVFDVYGRFVGDVLVRIGTASVNVNRWLLRQGWALPAFYSSMTGDEIQTLLADAAAAENVNRGLWPHLDDHATAFEWNLRYRRPSTNPGPGAETGTFLFPKLFRRLVTYKVNRRATITTGSFPQYLGDHPDECYETANFLAQGPNAATTRRLDDFVVVGRFTAAPGDLVFREKPSTLLGPGGTTPAW